MMKKPLLFSRAATALITPFSSDAQSIDCEAFRALVRRQRDAGISALVVSGTTGEASALTDRERTALIALAKEEAPALPVLAGCGAAVTAKAEHLIKEACAAGADGILAVTPYYNKCSQEGLYRHYMTLADASARPLCLYDVPSRTGMEISQETFLRLSAHENITAVKDAAGNAERTVLLSAAVGDALTIYAGCDGMTVPMLAAGAVGVISVLSNLFPGAVEAMCRSFSEGRTSEACAWQKTLARPAKALFSEVSPIPVKTVLAHLGLCRNTFRLPLCPPGSAETEALLSVFSEYSRFL